MIGQQGIPATHGGVERAVEEISARLVAAGHQVTVFNTTRDADRSVTEHRGIQIRYLPSTAGKHTGNLTLSAMSALVVATGPYDVAHFHAIGPSMFTPICRLRPRMAVVTTLHGRDDQRAKWGGMARRILTVAAHIAARAPHRVLVVSRALQDDMLASFGREALYVPNGVTEPPGQMTLGAEILDRFDLEPRKFLLSVGRLVPEKAIDDAMRAFSALDLDSDMRFVVVGGSSNTDGYVEELRALAFKNPQIVLTGPVYGDDLEVLYESAAGFVIPSRLEGLPLTFLEAAAHGLPVIASDIPPHAEIVGDLGSGPGHRLAPVGDITALTHELSEFLDCPEVERRYAKDLRERVLDEYSWDTAAAELERIYLGVLD
jgi:glycosyltransferase involved in cell wall biosynthesis